MADAVSSPDISDSNHGCLVCRSRKVRCDRTARKCRNCARLGVQCPGYSDRFTRLSRSEVRSLVEDLYRTAGLSKRSIGSCKQCRESKNKCSRNRPTCHRCKQKSLGCTYRDQDDSINTSDEIQEPLSASTEAPTLGIQPVQAEIDTTETTSWLYEASLPENSDLLLIVIDLFFERIAPLRCFGFMHKPSFLQSLDKGTLFEDYSEPLVLIICALGARICLYDGILSLHRVSKVAPGHLWAERARELVMKEISCPTLITLMTMILISEYAMRAEEHALAFITWGTSYQIMRLLGLDNHEKPLDQSSTGIYTRKETERRLVWSCFILDSFIGSGIDANLRWKEEFPPISLPCSDQCFLEQTSPSNQGISTTEMFTSSADLDNLNLRAKLIHLAYLRTKILRLIRNNDLSTAVWHPQSLFLELIQQLDIWYQHIQEHFSLSGLSIYIRRELSNLGSIFMLHFFYHSLICDLTRISLPGFDFPLASSFRTAPLTFRRQCQERCRFHADEISRLIQIGLIHGKRAFDDLHCAMAAVESVKIQIAHTCTATLNDHDERTKTGTNIHLNMTLLDMVHSERDRPNPYHRCLLPLLSKFGFDDIVSEWSESNSVLSVFPVNWLCSLIHGLIIADNASTSSTKENDELVGPAEIGYLSNAAPFRLATSLVRTRERLLQEKAVRSIRSTDSQNSTAVPRMPPIVSPVDTNQAALRVPGSVFSVAPLQQLVSIDVQNQFSTSTRESTQAPEVLEFDPGLYSQDFARLAEEMSIYFTSDMADRLF